MFKISLDTFCQKNNISINDIMLIYKNLENYKNEIDEKERNMEKTILKFKKDIENGLETSEIIQDLVEYKNKNKEMSKYFKNIEEMTVEKNEENITFYKEIKFLINQKEVRTLSYKNLFCSLYFLLFTLCSLMIHLDTVDHVVGKAFVLFFGPIVIIFLLALLLSDFFIYCLYSGNVYKHNRLGFSELYEKDLVRKINEFKKNMIFKNKNSINSDILFFQDEKTIC